MSTTYKLLLDKRRKNSRNTYPIRLRIYQGDDYKDFTPGIAINETFWIIEEQKVSTEHSESTILNDTLDSHVKRLKRLLLLHELSDKAEPTLIEIIAFLNNPSKQTEIIARPTVVEAPQSEPKPANSPPKQSIIKYGFLLADNLEKAKKVGNSIVYRTATNALLKFVKSEEFAFSDLTYEVLDAWNTKLLSQGLKVNAISNYMRTIRAIFNKAIRAKKASLADYPFKEFIISSEKTPSRSLPVEEMRKIGTIDLEGSYLEPYRDLFLLSFCLIGVNFVDLSTYTRANIVDDRLVFLRAKTHKPYSIKLLPEALVLIDRLRKPGYHLLHFVQHSADAMQQKKWIMQALRKMNNALKKIASLCKIKKNVTTYYARYAWSNIARKQCGYSKDMIAEALGHVYGNKVTGIYLDEFSSEEIDKMNTDVINAVWNKKG